MKRFALSAILLACFATNEVHTREIPPSFSNCGELFTENTQIKFSSEGSISGIAEAKPENNGWIIYLNPESLHTYLSEDTLRWIFLRECYFVKAGYSEDQQNDPIVAQKADCEAIIELHRERGHSRRVVRGVQRDLELLGKEIGDREWYELLGPRRSTYIYKCGDF